MQPTMAMKSQVAYTKMAAEVSAQRGLDRVFLTSGSVGELYTIHPSSRALSLAARQGQQSDSGRPSLENGGGE